MLESGNTKQWDSTLLSHVLLYSSHLLLANAIPGQVSIKEKSKKVIIPTSPKVDLRQYVHSKDKILLDLGGSDSIRVEVISVYSAELILLKLPQSFSSPRICDAYYVLSHDWIAVEYLSCSYF